MKNIARYLLSFEMFETDLHLFGEFTEDEPLNGNDFFREELSYWTIYNFLNRTFQCLVFDGSLNFFDSFQCLFNCCICNSTNRIYSYGPHADSLSSFPTKVLKVTCTINFCFVNNLELFLPTVAAK